MRCDRGRWPGREARARAGLLTSLLLLVGFGVLGAPCSPPPPPAPPEATVYFWSPSNALVVGEEGAFTVRIYSEETPIQAFDLGLDFDPDLLEVTQVSAGNFDSTDPGLTLTPELVAAQGTVRRIVDFRHGPGAAAGESVAFTVTILAKSPGTAQVSLVSSGVSTSNGEPFQVTSIPINITVSP